VAGQKNFWLRLTTASMQCLHLSEHFFHVMVVADVTILTDLPSESQPLHYVTSCGFAVPLCRLDILSLR